MLNSIMAIMAAAAIGGGAPDGAPAQNTQASNAPATKPAEDPNKVICRSEAETGSHFKKRVCHTRAEWDQMTQQAEQMMRTVNARAGMAQAQTSAFSGQ